MHHPYGFLKPSYNSVLTGITRGGRSLLHCNVTNHRSSFGISTPFAYQSPKNQTTGNTMTITPVVLTTDRKLVVDDRTILSDVPDNVISGSNSASGSVDGTFLGAVLPESSRRHVISLGTLRDVRFLSCFRHLLWWMSQKMGDRASEIPAETQFLLLEIKPKSSGIQSQDSNQIVYAVFLPILEPPFRSSLEGNPQNQLQLCIESGSDDTKSSNFSHSLIITAAGDPFCAVTAAVSAAKSHLKSFNLLNEKKLPNFINHFGWCTWDAFYHDVTQENVESGLESLSAAGVPPKFVIIDDGWQSVARDVPPSDGQDTFFKKPISRLIHVKENSKFQNKDDPSIGIDNIVRIAKERFGLKYVYVWHAIVGYWGGVAPGKYGSEVKFPVTSPGVAGYDTAEVTDWIAKQGVGLVNPKDAFEFYNDMHKYLAGAGVDGVKVDSQCILETLGEEFGGRVELTREYHKALDASVAKNFGADNGIIACMSHNTDSIYCSKQTAIVRASDDFFPERPMFHTIHIAAVAYNSIFFGEIMQPDWDMFHSDHPAAEYHASARAISGGPVYVSDVPGKHNFQLLKKLVLPDGSILRARLPGRPTVDCLFSDPTRDGVSLLKIWNMNKYAGVLGVYNCQGAAWSNIEKKCVFHHTQAETLSCSLRGRDVHLLPEAAVDPNWNWDCAVYCHGSGELVQLRDDAALPVSVKVLEHSIFTISPVKVLAPGFSFAPLGLIDMYNSGGAIQQLKYQGGDILTLLESDSGYARELNGLNSQPLENKSSQAVATIFMEVKGCGRLGAYSLAKPRKCLVDSETVNFIYDTSFGLLTLHLDGMPQSDKQVHDVAIEV